MDLGLLNARVLVVASSDGLGAATARRFSLEGAVVTVNGRRDDVLQATADAIHSESGGMVYAVAGDVVQSPADIVREAVSRMGGLDILVTNAGGPPSGNFDNFQPEDWRKATELTFLSAVELIHAALPHLRLSDRAAILAITSSAAKQPIDNLTLSNAIRPAVIGLTKTLALELAPEGIRVNSILPGMTQTGRMGHLMQARAEKNGTTPAEELDRASQAIPMKRLGLTEEFANAAVFLCSPAARYITGVSLPVDGGSIRATL